MGIRSKILSLKSKFVVHVKDVSRPYVVNLVQSGRFNGQVAVVTGGSGVIGRAISFRLAAEGAHVYVAGGHLDKINKVVEEINNAGYEASPLCFNLLDDTSIKEAFMSVVDEKTKIDLLVCCAGGGARSKMNGFVDQDVAVIDSVLKGYPLGLIYFNKNGDKLGYSKISEGSITVSSAGNYIKVYLTESYTKDVCYFDIRLNEKPYKGSQCYNFGIDYISYKSWLYA